MKKLLPGLLMTTMFSFNIAQAQEVVTKDTIGNTPLTISMDKHIDNIINDLEDNCKMANARREERPSYSSNDGYRTSPSTPSISATRPTVRVVPNRALTNAEICRQNPRILGYKIQLNVVKSNEEANEVKAYFRRRFPNLKVETDASLRPNYKILAGSYFTKASASGDLSRIRQYFKSAIPVQYRVFCVEAK